MNPRARVISLALLLVAIAIMTSPIAVSRVSGAGLKRGSVTIQRDEYGVPHVLGSTLEAVWFGVGYAQGQDRLWQAELLRRSATGRSAEIMGASAVATDVLARTLFGPLERRSALFDGASPDTKIIFESFVAGLNAWIAEATQSGNLPPEFAAVGLTPAPWTAEDSIAEGMLLLKNLGEFGRDELANPAALQDLIARLGPVEARKVFLDTHWFNDPTAFATVPAGGAVNRVRHAASAHTALPPRFGSADSAAWREPIAEIVWTPLGLGGVPNTLWMNRGTYNQLVHLGKESHCLDTTWLRPGRAAFRRPQRYRAPTSTINSNCSRPGPTSRWCWIARTSALLNQHYVASRSGIDLARMNFAERGDRLRGSDKIRGWGACG